MEKLTNAAIVLEENLKILEDIDFCKLYNKADQVEAVVNMIRVFIESIPQEVPRKREITDGFFAVSSVLETLQTSISSLEEIIMKVREGISSVV